MKNLEQFMNEATHVYEQLKDGKIDRATAKEMNTTLNIMIKAGTLNVIHSLARREVPERQLFSNSDIIEHKT